MCEAQRNTPRTVGPRNFKCCLNKCIKERNKENSEWQNQKQNELKKVKKQKENELINKKKEEET
jgi:hypothetical protein